MRTNHDHRATGVVHTLAEQVAAEASFLAFEHIAQGLEFAAATAGERLAALGIVDQAVHRFLQHAFLIADDDIRRAQFEQTLETVVAVDHAAVQVVQVGGCKAAAIQLHHRAQIGRDDRQNGHDHPFRAVARTAESFHHLQTGGGFLALLLGLGCAHLIPEFFGEFIKVKPAQDVEESLGAHIGAENLSPALFEFAITDLAQEGERTQFQQFIAYARVLVLRNRGLVFKLSAQGFHLFFSFGLDAVLIPFSDLRFRALSGP